MLPSALEFNLRRHVRVNTIYKISKNIGQPIDKNSNKKMILSKIHNSNFKEDDLIKQKINFYQFKNFSTNINDKILSKPNIYSANTCNNNSKSNININNNTSITNLIQNSNYQHSRNYEMNTVENMSKIKKNNIFNSCDILSTKNEKKNNHLNRLYNFDILSPKDSKQNNIFNNYSKKNIIVHKINNDLLKVFREKLHVSNKLNCNIIKIEKNISSKNIATRNNSSLKENKTVKNNSSHNSKNFFYKKYNITKNMKLKKISKSQNKERKENSVKNTIPYYNRNFRKIGFSIQLPKINRISLNERVFKKTEDYGNYLYNLNNLDYYYIDYFSAKNNQKKSISKVFMNNPLIREKISSSSIKDEQINNFDY